MTDATVPEAADQAPSDGPEDNGSIADAGETDVNIVDAGPPVPALSPDAATVGCPTTIEDSLSASDGTQTGRVSRVAPVGTCGTTKDSPGVEADPSNPHLYRAYRFVNSTAASSCFTFQLTYPTEDDSSVGDTDASIIIPPKYMNAYTTFYPADIDSGYLADVGAVLTSPQTMAITVPAGGTIDVVVEAVDVAPAGVGSFTLSCTAQ